MKHKKIRYSKEVLCSEVYESWNNYGQYVFYCTSKLGEISLFFLSVKDFDTGLLERYTVKVLVIMHASSL